MLFAFVGSILFLGTIVFWVFSDFVEVHSFRFSRSLLWKILSLVLESYKTGSPFFRVAEVVLQLLFVGSPAPRAPGLFLEGTPC